MLTSLKEEKRPSDLGRAHRLLLLVLVSMGSSTIYAPAYLKGVFYEPLMGALGVTNAQLGALLSAYAITATICYLPSGIVADKVRVRTLAWVGFGSTAILTYLYALLPSFGTLMLIFVGMGFTTILIWWGIRFKLVRLISGEKEYAKNIGLSYGIYGAAGLIIGLINTAIISALANNIDMAVRTLLIFLGSMIMLLAIMSFIFIPRFEGEISSGEKNAFDFRSVGIALKSPVVWLAALCMFFVYFYYTGVTYTTPYLQNAVGASLGVVSIVSVVRTYGITLLSGPIFGWLADKANSPSKIIVAGSLASALGILALVILPANTGMAVVAAIVIILLGFIANGTFGIVSGQLTEGRVPLTIFGTATGILSVVGFLPDTFSSTWFGAIMDAKGNDAFVDIFWINIGAAVLAMASAIALMFYVQRNRDRLERTAAEAAAAAGLELRPDGTTAAPTDADLVPTVPTDAQPQTPTPAPAVDALSDGDDLLTRNQEQQW
ncbi:MAG: MFS transporter [Brooklawnia sp.]|nr:MFS transporter [Brooklawnia sp.]